MSDFFKRFRGKVMSTKVPPEILRPAGAGSGPYLPAEVGDAHPMPLAGHIWEPVTEIALHDGWPINLVDNKPVTALDVVGRPVHANIHELNKALWPRPDPSKRWRLFIQEDTRP